jgi:hypothetical protein
MTGPHPPPTTPVTPQLRINGTNYRPTSASTWSARQDNQKVLLSATDAEIQEILNDLKNAFPGVSVSFGEVQGALNTR